MRNSTSVVSYAQNREDILIAAFFKEKERGFYVDIGANHPRDDSVTKFFYDQGWRGINVEPSSRLFKLLEQERPRDINVKSGISDKKGTLILREYEGWYAGLSTFSKEMQKENKDIAKYHDVEVKVTTLSNLFSENKIKEIDFLKVDVEGHEYNVLSGNNWDKYRPKLICIETNHTFKDWHSILENAKYYKVFFDGLNEYYLSEEAADLENNFSYVESIIGANVVDVEIDRVIKSLERRIELQQSELSTYKSEVLRLNRDLIELKKVVPLTKQLFKAIDAFMRRKIEQLNKKKYEKSSQPDLNINKEGDIQQLLKQTRQYDLNVYYSTTRKRDRFSYSVVARVYNAMYKFMFIAGKQFFRLARKIKK